MLDVTKGAESSQLSSEFVATRKEFLQEMKTLGCVHTQDFRIVCKTQELQGGGFLGESVGSLLCGSLFNVRRQ